MQSTVIQFDCEAQIAATETMSQAQNAGQEEQAIPEVHRRYFPSGEWSEVGRDNRSLCE